jgi:hypothetical protein
VWVPGEAAVKEAHAPGGPPGPPAPYGLGFRVKG